MTRSFPPVAAVAVLLLAAGCGSGGSPDTGGARTRPGPVRHVSVVKAPLPAGARGNYLFELDHVACATVESCAAIGNLSPVGAKAVQALLYVERSGTWSVSEPLPPPGLAAGGKGDLRLDAVACPAAGRCVAVGRAGTAGSEQPLVLTQQGSRWHEDLLPLPAGTSGGELDLLSCPSAGNCTALATYDDAKGNQQFRFVAERDGTWGPPTAAVVPPNAGAPNPDTVPDWMFQIDSLSCSSPGNCGAVGTYGDTAGSSQGWLLTETHGVWAKGAEARLPSNADTREGGSWLLPVIGVGPVSCPADGECVATGGYGGRMENQYGMILAERDGRWSPATEVPLPPNAGPDPKQGNLFASPMGGLACASPGSCVGAGSFVDKSGQEHAFLLAERAGTWTATQLPLPADAGGSPATGSFPVTCAPGGGCIAGGAYPAKSKTARLVFLSEANGSWAAGRGVALPAGTGKYAYLTSISCPRSGGCVAVGVYATHLDGYTQGGLIATIRP